ncbi:transmembrane protein, putative [Actinidia rufa]|uniref:Transmembrane protein, putative n=1 Tax=Actinidia rufa TaxID=165716 RepID=A0A7J0HEX9_9ERIC|nr:transmembrane protein, putative [Actinidia rufa]
MVKKVVSTMPVHFQVNYKESGPSDRSLTICSSEVFYIPRHFVSDLIDLVDLVGSLEIHHKVEVSMFFMAMDSPQNFDSVLSTMIYETQARPSNSSRLYSAQVSAVNPWSVSSEPEFIKLIKAMAEGALS